MKDRAIELKVDLHESGRRTLKHRSDQGPYLSYTGALLANGNGEAFYRAVASKIATLAAAGRWIKFEDWPD